MLKADKKYKIGSFDRRITFEQQTSTTDELGHKKDTWTTVDTVWCNVSFQNDSEPFLNNVETYKNKEVFTIRYDSTLNDQKLRIVFDSQNYNIESIKEIGRKRFLQIIAIAYE